MKKPWSRKFAHCIRCGKTDSRHVAKGWCSRCYGANRRNNAGTILHGGPHFKRANQLLESGLNIGEIAKAIGLSRQRVHLLVRRNPTWGKPVRRTCQRCGQRYLGGRGTHLCCLCTSSSRAVRFCAKCGKRKCRGANLCLRCHMKQLRVFGRPKELRLAKRRRLQGWTYDRIASQFHCSGISVWRAINRK